ncbi:MAG: DUF2807 domain-containing protein, partial [Planctomycetota bacterium]
MRQIHILLTGCLAMISCCGCNIANFVFEPGVAGSGVMMTEARAVGEFQKIKLSGSGSVIVQCGNENSLTVTADDNLLEWIQTEVRGDTLFITSTKNIRPTDS